VKGQQFTGHDSERKIASVSLRAAVGEMGIVKYGHEMEVLIVLVNRLPMRITFCRELLRTLFDDLLQFSRIYIAC
jgi:hypothetical protein